MEVQTFFDVEADPTLSVVEKGAEANGELPTRRDPSARRWFTDGCSENHVGNVRAPRNALRRACNALYGHP